MNAHQRLLASFRSRFADRPSDELRAILEKRDASEWSADSFVVIEELLKEREAGRAPEPQRESDAQSTEVPVVNAEIEVEVGADEAAVETKDVPNIETPAKEEFGGIGRSGYFIATILLAIFSAVLATISEGIRGISPLFFFIGFCVLFLLRSKNLGLGFFSCFGQLAFLLFFPFVNIYVFAVSFAAPEGYERSKKLDTAGKVICVTVIAIEVVILVIVAFAIASSYLA